MMKKILLVLPLVAIWMLTSCSQNMNDDRVIPQVQTPDVVLQSFQSIYPNATDVSWRSTQDFHDAFFALDAIKSGARFISSGEHTLEWGVVSYDEIPALAKEYIKQYYASHEFLSARKITDFTVGKGELSFEVDFKLKHKESTVTFDAEGKFVKSSHKDTLNEDGCEDDCGD